MVDRKRQSAFPRGVLCVALVFLTITALGMGVTLPADHAQASPVTPKENIPKGWPWKIDHVAYPTLGYPQIIRRGRNFTLEFDVVGMASAEKQPDVSDWDVRLVSSNDGVPTIVDCTVQSAGRGDSKRWEKGYLDPSVANGEWAGPWAGREVWQVTVNVPSDTRADLYDLSVTAEGSTTVTDSQPHAVQVVDRYKDDYNFIQISDFHINDPRGPSDWFVPGKYPDPSQFKNYQYNLKVLSDVNLINPDFLIMTGDLPFGYPDWAYNNCPKLDPTDTVTDYTGKSPDWNGEYNKAYQQLLTLNVPVVCLPGNHDSYNLETQWGSVLRHANGRQDGAHIWPTMIGPRFFSWDYGDKFHLAAIFSYDKLQRNDSVLVQKQRSSTPIAQTPPADGGAGWMRPNQQDWLVKDLNAAKGKYDMLAMATHAPFYGTSGWDTWDEQGIMETLKKYARDYGVEVVLSGHTHKDDVWVDSSGPGPVTYLNTTTTSFGTNEYPGCRRVFVKNGSLYRYNYKPGIYSYPTYKDTQIKIHSSAQDAQKALAHLDTPSVEGSFDAGDLDSVDKSFTCSNNLIEGEPAVVLDNTVVEYTMADLGDINRYRITGGTLVDYWRPGPGTMTFRVRMDDINPGKRTSARVMALYIAAVTPNSSRSGRTLDVQIVGQGTNFIKGRSMATFSGEGISVNSTTVHDTAHLTANITIGAAANAGPRDVNVITGSEVPYGLKGGFRVNPTGPYIEECSPTEVVQGHEVDLHVLGGNTHFKNGVSEAYVSGTGVAAESNAVSDGTHMTARIEVSKSAPPGARDVDVITGTEVPHPLVKGLTVHQAPSRPPYIHRMTPPSGPVGAKITMTGGNFGETRGSSRVVIGGVPVTEYVYWSDTEIVFIMPFGAKSGPVRVETPWGTSESLNFDITDFNFYFAEGTARPNFDPYLCIQNPGSKEAAVKITYMLGDGGTKEQELAVAPNSRFTLAVKAFLGEGDDAAHDFSCKVDCTNGQEIIVERPMYFNYRGELTGGSDVIGALSPSLEYYFAEGTARPNFEPYLCIQNPGSNEAAVRITYIKGDGSSQAQDLTVAPASRETIAVKDVLGEGEDAAHDFSCKVESANNRPIIVERPMYFNYQGAISGGSDVVGETAPLPVYYFAEGSCRPDFDPYICIQNPGQTDAIVEITYMKGDGTTSRRAITVDGGTRTTIRAKDVLGEGDDAAHDFSLKVESLNNRDIVVERPMYFNYKGVWSGGHDVVGASAPAPSFYFAEGTTRPGFDTYICLQNPEIAHAEVKITYMKGDGTIQEQVVGVPARSRITIAAKDVVGVGDDLAHDFSCKVESTNGVNIVAERPIYFGYHGAWTGGHDVVGF